MASTYMTPGVYIEEKNAFPGSAVAVATAVPVFIGYTEKAEFNGKSLHNVPTRISSFAEYVESFGGAFRPIFKIDEVPDAAAQTAPQSAPSTQPPAEASAQPQAAAPAAAAPPKETVRVNGKSYIIDIKDNYTAYFFNCIRLFYANGGGDCYIYSVGTYDDSSNGLEIKAEDFIGTTANPTSVFEVLEKEYEPTLIVIPDIIKLGVDAYIKVYSQVLIHCAKVQSRMGIFDLRKQSTLEKTDVVAKEFRDNIGTNFLNYGMAYYPWLNCGVVQPDEVDFRNIDASVNLANLMTDKESAARDIITAFAANDATKKADPAIILNYHQSLKAASPSYSTFLDLLRARMNELPPSAAIAGIYTLVDNSRGVWKAPANVSLAMVNGPSVNISADAQKSLNVDVLAGKSINVIRPFPGIGTLIWGARTLDGNSQDWRYINVRRTIIMIEQSLKLATRAYVFEPNDASTWITVKSMFNNFLQNLWKLGALAGAVPEQAFDVQIGLGATMTPTDILDGIMRITVKLAIVRPAEFIVITFQQQQQQS